MDQGFRSQGLGILGFRAGGSRAQGLLMFRVVETTKHGTPKASVSETLLISKGSKPRGSGAGV